MGYLRRRRGFTLLELIIAMAVFAAGLLAVCSMGHTVIHNNRMSRRLTTAVNLAQDKIDDLRAGAYDHVHGGIEMGLDEKGVAGTGIFNRSVSVSEDLGPNLKTVAVTVWWGDPNPRSLTLKACIARP